MLLNVCLYLVRGCCQIKSKPYFFRQNSVFANISCFCDQIERKLLFHLKALQTRTDIDVYKFFVAQVVPEIYAKNVSLKTARCVFSLLTVKIFFLQTYLNFLLSHGDWIIFSLAIECSYLLYSWSKQLFHQCAKELNHSLLQRYQKKCSYLLYS